MLNSGNNDREQIWQLFIQRGSERSPDGGVTVTLGVQDGGVKRSAQPLV
jgi:hypothetical protein